MSKQMKSAYSALRMKDALIAVLEELKPTMLVLCAISLLGCYTVSFSVFMVVLCVWAALRGMAAVLNWRMRHLGFDEIQLERLALA